MTNGHKIQSQVVKCESEYWERILDINSIISILKLNSNRSTFNLSMRNIVQLTFVKCKQIETINGKAKLIV